MTSNKLKTAQDAEIYVSVSALLARYGVSVLLCGVAFSTIAARQHAARAEPRRVNYTRNEHNGVFLGCEGERDRQLVQERVCVVCGGICFI